MATRRTPTQYNWADLEFDETILSRHFTSPRHKKIAFVVVHHMAMVGKGDGKANDACYRTWQTRKASAHYGIDGRFVRQFVWDRDAAWSTGDSHGNHAGISIEHANSSGSPTWRVSDETWKTGARLAAFLHKVYDLGRPVAGKTLRRHRDFSSTACPGPFLGGTNWDEYVAEAQRVYDGLVAPSPAPKPPAPKPLIELGTFKLTLPVGTKGKPREIHPIDDFEYAPFFVQHSDRVAFRAPVNGVATSGSKYPRCELREMKGAAKAAWSNKTGLHQMTLDAAVTVLPGRKPEVVAAQIHDADDDVCMILVSGTKVYLSVSLGKGKGSQKHLLDASYKLGTRFRVVIAATAGQVRVYYKSDADATPTRVRIDRLISGGYFKAGQYCQANASNGTGYGETVIYRLDVTHA